MDNARTAVEGCNFLIALASADHMVNFDPNHAWLVANHGTLRRLSERQRVTEQGIWQASSALSEGELKRARSLANSAADTAVSCQTQTLSGLLRGIDTAIEQTRIQKNLKRGQAAAQLLPGLVSLSHALSASQSGSSIDVNALIGSTAASFGVNLPLNALDPCAFKYGYPDRSSLEPACLCPGYRFDPGSFRCTPP